MTAPENAVAIQPPFTGEMARRCVPCDYCGAEIGERCRTLVGAGTYPHHVRWLALNALAAEALAGRPA